ncbi:hypothetical protein BCR35DRAFT_331355 [Leucosporidium creatinivorum]|uniref:BTB domain-containing protein n=1 Tax=Leucosporidium creatinivorum TaxID=106004 RepID=A0A1Y2FGB4_9BASI|nr:hypothetical protein BCR35DRAFT_331355 [Leucosporidium creatinivorum]
MSCARIKPYNSGKRTSTNFAAEDADLLLISKDNVVFRVHRLYLEAHSPVFKNMFELGEAAEKGAELPQVQLEETSAILEIALPYVYPNLLEPFKLDLKGDFAVVKMFEKYGLDRGSEAVLAALPAKAGPNEPRSYELAVSFVLASTLNGMAARNDVLERIIRTDTSWTDLEPHVQKLALQLPASVGDCDKLRKLLEHRCTAVEAHRRKAGPELARSLDKVRSPKIIRAAFELWEASASLNSASSLRTFKRKHAKLFEEAERVGGAKSKEKAPPATSAFERAWDALVAKVKSLPTSLDGSFDFDAIGTSNSSNFNSADADLLLISTDNVVFRVHRLYLEATSPIFKDMFTLGSAVEKNVAPKIELGESTAVLEMGLPYVYPARLDPFELQNDSFWSVVSFFDKYEIARGLEAVLAALVQRDLVDAGSPLVGNLVTTFALASHIGDTRVRDKVLKRLMDTNFAMYELTEALATATAYLPGSAAEFAKLERLFEIRKAKLDKFRQQAGIDLAIGLRRLVTPKDLEARNDSILASIELWERSSSVLSSSAVKLFENSFPELWVQARRGSAAPVYLRQDFNGVWSDFRHHVYNLPSSLKDVGR